MLNPASIPVWVALIALVSATLSPIIQGWVAKNSPLNKVDTAERFTRIAAGVADDYQELHEEARQVKPRVWELLRILDRVQFSDPLTAHRIQELTTEIRERMT